MFILNKKDLHGHDYKADIRQILGLVYSALPDDAAVIQSDSADVMSAETDAMDAVTDWDTIKADTQDALWLYYAALYRLIDLIWGSVYEPYIIRERGEGYDYSRDLAELAKTRKEYQRKQITYLQRLGVTQNEKTNYKVLPGSQNTETGNYRTRPNGI